jgi:hypothetical protein
MMHEVVPSVAPCKRMLAPLIVCETKAPGKRRAQFDATISPIIDLQGTVKQYAVCGCAILAVYPGRHRND